MSLETNVSLLVATLDLKMVKSLRDAIRTADLASGKRFPAAAIGPAPNSPLAGGGTSVNRRHLEPEPVIEPRRHFHPTPVYERRPVIHPTPRIAAECDTKLAPAPSEGAREMKLLPEPPWRSFPWKNPVPSPEFIKVIVRVNDKVRRGQIIDLFI